VPYRISAVTVSGTSIMVLRTAYLLQTGQPGGPAAALAGPHSLGWDSPESS
jgi:hypothetical protein